MTKLAAAALVFAAVFSLLPQPVQAKGEVIRVGYSGSGVVLGEDGTYSGYVVAYLEEVAKYTGWEYEYSYGNWNDNVERMRNGEIDLMGLVRHTDEREEDFLFSDLPMAHDYTALYALDGSDFYYQDYQRLDGCTVGAMDNAIYGAALLSHMERLGLSCEVRYYPSEPTLDAALLSGEVDLIADDGLTSSSKFKVIDRFQLENTYFVANKDDHALVEQLDWAMQQIQIENPQIQEQLSQSQYSGAQTNFYLTREEHEYIQSAGPILVKGVQRRPLGYVKDGSYVGVLADYLSYLGSLCGLEFRYEVTGVTDLEEHAQRMAGEDYIFLYAKSSSARYSGSQPVLTSNTLLESSLVYVTHKENSEDELSTIALPDDLTYFETVLNAQGEDFEFRYYPTSAACMDALLSGEADATLQDSYVASYLLQKPQYGDHLVINYSFELPSDLCLYASTEDEILIRILDKVLGSLPQEQKLSAVTSATIYHPYEFTLWDALYENALVIQVSTAFLLAIFALALMLRSWVKTSKEQTQENEALQEKLQLDKLTGLYNRDFFFQRAREMIDSTEDKIFIVRLNIRHFKIINELYGEAKGDTLLQLVGHELKAMSQKTGLVAGRFNADRFLLCIRDQDFHTMPMPRQAAAPSLGTEVTLSYGVYAVGEQRDIPINIMCDRADMANATRGKNASEYIRYYSDTEHRRLLREQEIEREMEKALAERQFTIYIQPKYDLDTGSIVGGEALVRWIHPVHGMIPPGEFIGLFEHNGFIKELDYYVWEECCRFLSESKKSGLPVLPLSINVSRIHFYASGLQSKLLELLNKYQLDPSELELEITESLCAEDSEVIFSKCRDLQALGFKIAMDDFGSGYSSLNMLKEMPLDIIKMDLRFLSGGTNEEQEENGRSILRALIELAHTMKLKVVVEGLETKEQRDFIQKIGSCSAQGYYFSRPVDRQSYENLLSR